MIFHNLEDVVFHLMQGGIILKGPVYFLLSLGALIKILFCARYHIIGVAWAKIMFIGELVTHTYVTMFLGWIQVRPCI